MGSPEVVVSLRGLIALLLVLGALIAAVVYLKPKPKPAAPSEDAPLVAPLAEDKLERIEIACGETRATLARASGSWRLSSPFEAEADPRAVHTLVAAIQEARVRKPIADAPQDLSPFGLSPPACTVTYALAGEPNPRTLVIGRASPLGTERYAKDPSGRVVLTDGSLYTGVDRPPEALREKRLFPVDSESVTRILLEGPGGSFDVRREKDAWRLAAPIADRAAGEVCARLARDLTGLELHALESTPAPKVVQADRRIRIVLEAGPGTAPREAFVATAGVQGKRVAWRGGSAPFAGLIDESAASALSRRWETLRDPTLTSFSSPDVVELVIDRQGATLTLRRAPAATAWTVAAGASAPVAADGEKVDALLERLRDLRGSEFLPTAPSGAPSGSLVVRSASADLARLTWGPLPPVAGQPESIWVAAAARPGAWVRLDASRFGPLPKTAAEMAPQPSSSPSPSPSPSSSPSRTK